MTVIDPATTHPPRTVTDPALAAPCRIKRGAAAPRWIRPS
jgi:hypothetical protein